MKRADIPIRLRIARAADVAKIPDAALKAMAPADVAPRLLAADEYRRRASVPHLDGDLYRYRLDLAREVLETTDPGRAAELVKAAGVTPDWQHEAFTGMHGHEHPDNGVRGSTLHDHRHAHDGTASHKHDHPGARPGAAPGQAAGKSAAPSTRLAKSASHAPRSITVPTPALDRFTSARSFIDGVNTLARKGELGIAVKELAAVAAAHDEVTGQPGSAHYYEQRAKQVTDPVLASGYRQLAREARGKAGTS